MPVIGLGLFVQIADRLAKQARIIEQATLDAQQTGGGKFYPRIHSQIPSTGDIDVENDLIKVASELDDDIRASDLFNNIYAPFIVALNRHVQRLGFSSLDKYLSTTGPSGINVDDGFAKAYRGVTGAELDSINVFGPETNIGYLSFSGSGVATLTKQNAVGTGTGDHTDTASAGLATGNHAAAKMRVFVASGVMAATEVSFVMKLENGTVTPSGLLVTFTPGEASTVGTSKNIGDPSQDFFLDISSVQVAGGDAGLVLQVKSVLEREVQL